MEKSITETDVNKLSLYMKNYTPYDWAYVTSWFDSGELNSGIEWPSTIKSGDKPSIGTQGKSQFDKGVSGYVTYNINGQYMTFAFSCPVAGSNKVGVGNDGRKAWENMGSHYENPAIYNWTFTTPIPFNLQASIENSPGDSITAICTMTSS